MKEIDKRYQVLLLKRLMIFQTNVGLFSDNVIESMFVQIISLFKKKLQKSKAQILSIFS